jgi:hypothetical protein
MLENYICDSDLRVREEAHSNSSGPWPKKKKRLNAADVTYKVQFLPHRERSPCPMGIIMIWSCLA